MGKGGKSKAKNTSAKAAQDDDALLEAAIAENRVLAELRAKEAAAAAPQPPSAPLKGGYPPLTMQEMLEKMSKVHTFNIVKLKDGKKDCYMSPTTAAIDFYADADDAREALQAAQAGDLEAKLELEAVPLGKAFAVSQGLMGVTAPVPCKLHFSSATTGVVGEAGIPENMRQKMRPAGPFPLFSVTELRSPGAFPVFLSYEDLCASWVKSGRALEKLPKATEVCIDLRVLAASALQDHEEFFKHLVFLAPRSSVLLQKELAVSTEGQDVRANMLAAKTIVDAQMAADAVTRAAHVDDTPPALT